MMFGKPKMKTQPLDHEAITYMRQEINSLKNSRDHLKGEVIRMKAEIETLQRKLDTSFQFFEIRVDQIYSNLKTSGAIDPAAEGAALALHLPTNPDWEKLIFASQASVLAPGPIPSPITLSGMRIDTRYATEKLQYTEITGGHSEIAVFGPYRKLLTGKYALTMSLEPVDSAGKVSLYLEVFTIMDGREIEVAGLPVRKTKNVKLTFEWGLDRADCEVQFRIHQRGGDAVRLFGMELLKK